jgi:transglutaminase-like putative cysteine protease
MLYDISHQTTITYTWDVALSQHLLHLAPRFCPQQTTHHHSLLIEPAPTLSKDDVDFFGNPTTYLTVEEPHNKLSIVSSCQVEIHDIQLPEAAATVPWDSVAGYLGNQSDPVCLDASQFIYESPYTVSGQAEAYAQASFPAGRPILEGALDLMSRIFNEFKYEGGVTDISTPIDRVIADKRGVCQDFAHLQIACLRSLGLPARYVSGYLRTHPPEGQERKIGADASHAWLAIWVPEFGWVDLDPTNNMMPGNEHITVAWGRDYGDVSPINGMVLGGGEHKVAVAVDVAPVELAAGN